MLLLSSFRVTHMDMMKARLPTTPKDMANIKTTAIANCVSTAMMFKVDRPMEGKSVLNNQFAIIVIDVT